MISVALNPKFTALDDDGIPLVGAKLYTYASGTTTPKTTWTDYAKSTPNTNPIILDSNGQADVWTDGIYRFKLLDANDVVLWTVDGIGGTVYDSLNSFLALSIIADRMIYGSDVDTLALTPLYAFGRTLLAGASAADMRNTLIALNRYLSEISATATDVVPDAYVVALTPTLTAYTSGSVFSIKFPSANTVTEPTLNIDTLGAKTLKRSDGSTLAVGEIRANQHLLVKYDGTDMLILNLPLVDSAAAIGSARTIGTGALQACAGNDGRLLSRCQVFTSGGTWTRPTDVTTVRVIAVGGGGGGGGGGSVGGTGSGGGGGAGCMAEYICTVSGNVSVTVGGGGIGGNQGTLTPIAAGNGGDSSFGTLCVAGGGIGGTSGINTPANGAGGAGGSASGSGTAVQTKRMTGGDGQSATAIGRGGGNALVDYVSGSAGEMGGSGLFLKGAGGNGGLPTNNGAAGADGYVLVMW